MRKGFAVHIAGDQHLGSTVQYGVDEWGDAGYALCVPSIANFWPRRWYPPRRGANSDPSLPRYTGDYRDGFGNRITVHAVSNPAQTDRHPARLHQRAPGYGIARFDRTTRRVLAGDGPYEGWPVSFDQRDGYGRPAVGTLPTFVVTGMADPVVQVENEVTGEIVYTLRVKGTRFAPPVFEAGRYAVRLGEPGSDRWQTYSGVSPDSAPDSIGVVF
jgi:hypothetical protein